MSVRYDFMATNAKGVPVHSFGDLDIARRWVREHAGEHDGLKVECVTTTVVRQVVYRPRHASETASNVTPLRRAG